LIYSTAAYFGQFGYVFAWYGIIAAIDIFVARFNIYKTDKKGERNSRCA